MHCKDHAGCFFLLFLCAKVNLFDSKGKNNRFLTSSIFSQSDFWFTGFWSKRELKQKNQWVKSSQSPFMFFPSLTVLTFFSCLVGSYPPIIKCSDTVIKNTGINSKFCVQICWNSPPPQKKMFLVHRVVLPISDKIQAREFPIFLTKYVCLQGVLIGL